MNIVMMATDAMVCGMSFSYLYSAGKFVKAAKRNMKEHRKNRINEEHFTDHFWASLVGIFGGCLVFAFSILHFIGQNIYIIANSILEKIEYGENIGFVCVLFSGVMFMYHMKAEETPGHPFYIQEYGTKDKP